MPTSTSSPSLADGMEVLSHIETALQSMLARASAPEEPSHEPGGAAHAAAMALELLTERQARLQASLDRAAQDADRAEASLSAEADAIGVWLRQGQIVREGLALAAIPSPAPAHVL